MSHQAYQQAALRGEPPRSAEYRLFAQVTLALIAAQEAAPGGEAARLDALEWNRRLWTVLASDCAGPRNRLPEAARAGIISLGLWVERHTQAVLESAQEIGPLIEVNRTVMQGLGDLAP